MKKILISIFFIFSSFLATAQVSGKSKNWDFSISPYTGLSCGNLAEYLYSQYDKDFTVSDLQWNYILWNAGLKADYRYKQFFVTGDFTYFAPFSCGKMTDSDYNKSFKTNQVIFDNTNKFSIRGELNFGYAFNVYKNHNGIFSILPVIKGIYSYHKFSGKNGKGFLGDGDYIVGGVDVPWNSDKAEYHEFYDIDYERISIYTFSGVGLKYYKNAFKIFAGFYISPFSYALDFDTHHGKPEDEYNSYCYTYSYFTQFIFDAGFSIELNNALDFFVTSSILFGAPQKGFHVTNYGHRQGIGIFAGQSEYYLSPQNKGMNVFDFTLKTGVRYFFAK